MCRSIKTLRPNVRDHDHEATHEEIEAAALQFVRKVSGYRKPAQRNAEVFDAAVAEIAAATHRLLESLQTARAS
jgi:hypothetical protein